MKSFLTAWENEKSLWWSSANILLLFWHLLVHFPQIIAAPITQGLFYEESMWCIMPGSSVYGRLFIFYLFLLFSQKTSSVFKHEKLFVKDAKNPLWPTLFYILWASLVFVWPSTYALTYGNNKYYKCSRFMPSCETNTMRCKLLWDKTTGIIFIGNQNHNLANCWQFSIVNAIWLGWQLLNLGEDQKMYPCT